MSDGDYRMTCDHRPRDVEVLMRRCNYSAFNGYHRTASRYSLVRCRVPGCGQVWRTKAAYADRAPDAEPESSRG